MLKQLVPEVCVDAIEEAADATNLNRLVKDCEIVLDCTDNFETRQIINRFCVKKKIPLVIGAAIGWSGQLMVVDTSEDNSACYACIFEENREFEDDSCGAFGVFSPVVGTVGILQAGEAIKTLLKIRKTSDTLLLFDGLSLSLDRINLVKNKNCKICSQS